VLEKLTSFVEGDTNMAGKNFHNLDTSKSTNLGPVKANSILNQVKKTCILTKKITTDAPSIVAGNAPMI
jgi:hypothetical protein